MQKIKRLLRPLGLAAYSFRQPAALVGIAALGIATLSAQSITTGDIAGTVKDPSGALVPGSTVTLKSLDTGETRTQTTNQSGEYRFTTLRAGNYEVSAVSSGLKSEIARLAVSIGQVATLDIVAKPQASQQIIEVTEAAPLMQSENANLATTYNSHQLENLPAPGNDMTAYAFTAPGVTISTGSGYGSFSAFGLPAVSNLFTINGNDNMDPYLNLNNSGASNLTLGSNEISEAAVVINGYTGQYGRQAGANVNYVTKSGTNAFHGNAAWWYNDRVLNANDWFNNATGTARPVAISNEWADSIGGPIVKNKLFFFVDNEGLRYVLANSFPVYIPTTDFASNVLSNLAVTTPTALPLYQKALNLYAGATGVPRSSAVTASTDAALGCGDILSTGVPTTNADGSITPADPGAARALAAGFGTTRACARVFQSNVNNLNTEWLMAGRVDFNLTSKDRLYVRYNTDHGVQATGTDPINSVFNANSIQPSYGGQFGYTREIGSTMVNQLLLSASYYTAIFNANNLPAALSAFPTTFSFADGLYTNVGGNDNVYPQGRKVRQWQLVDDYSIVKGRHTIKFGTNVRKNFISTYAYGPGTSGLLTFFSMTDFLDGSLGNGSTYAQSFSNIGAESLAMYSAGFYGQDEWRVRPNLILTLALRLDRNSNIRCAVGCFSEMASQPFGQVDHSATTPYNATIQTGLKQAFPGVEPIVPEPRIGFAWNASSSTVLRGGFGIFTDLYQGLIADRLITNAPAETSFTTSSGTIAPGDPASAFSNVANSAVAFQNGFASGQTLGQIKAAAGPGFAVPNFNTVNRQLYNPKYYEWNFELQHSFTNNYLVSLNYVGNRGYQEINQYLFPNEYSPLGFQGLPTAPPDPRFGEIRELGNQGYSNYNGLVTSFRWRVTSNFTGNFSYTWSHALDTCSNSCLEPFNSPTFGAPSIRYQISPLGQQALNYGNADYDIRHSLNANYVYTLPTSRFQNWLAKGVLGGWTVAGTFFYHSSYPYSIVDSGVRSKAKIGNASGIATQTFLAELLGGNDTTCSTPNATCFGSDTFAAPEDQRTFGNLARNSFRGPGYFDTDLTLNKQFAITERFHLLVGANFFNILNHPNFNLPVNNTALGNFGQILQTVSAPTSAYGSFQGSAVSGRVIQTHVEVRF